MAAWESGESGNPAGRPAGVPNKTTKAMREAFLEAFDDLGGVPALVAWAMKDENRSAFYALISKLLPREVKVDGEGTGFALIIQEERIKGQLRRARERAAEHDKPGGGDGA